MGETWLRREVASRGGGPQRQLKTEVAERSISEKRKLGGGPKEKSEKGIACRVGLEKGELKT